ncbi:hypothetical protein [Chengkuizengella axinellae]|uniref:Uncharacterized protein n=1 Tax=Chengkuizengella axinellae TaxID=3064388 RepID=A0ABT9J497_9BACL|nr:hypothetical protein [Chengkuizengella sp. 2205SS18-9]MDP5276428.1 hypothetical protein [Chengkuizengella sp. 2205SS18-9]
MNKPIGFLIIALSLLTFVLIINLENFRDDSSTATISFLIIVAVFIIGILLAYKEDKK